MVKLIAGLMGGSVASGSASVSTADSLRPLLSLLQKHNVADLDTARVYNSGKGEEAIGAIPKTATEPFTIATKAPGFSPGSLTYDKVIAACNASLHALQQDSIALYYFHGPDRQTPLQESLRAVNDLREQGKIAAFGVSNYRADEVETICDICSKQGWLRPTVYQGGYNALARGGETQLFPTLRKHGIAFYAFSPLAGGYFSKSADQLRTPAEGSRMQQMKAFQSMYVNETSLALHDELREACGKEGIEMKEAALRWLLHHSGLRYDEREIVGASSEGQMGENLKACEGGPLPQRVVEVFEKMWRTWSEEGGNEGRMRYSV